MQNSCYGNYGSYGNNCYEAKEQKCFKKEIKCCEKSYDLNNVKYDMMKKQNNCWM